MLHMTTSMVKSHNGCFWKLSASYVYIKDRAVFFGPVESFGSSRHCDDNHTDALPLSHCCLLLTPAHSPNDNLAHFSPSEVFWTGDGEGSHRVVDIYKMGKDTRRNLVEAALQTEDQDHEDYLQKIKARYDA